MPRTARASVGGICYHVINRGNGRAEVFHDEDDHLGFIALLEAGYRRLPVKVLGYCLMPNHFHLVLWPPGDGDLSRWMQWLLTCHVRRYHRRYGGSGHVWQGRFKAFPIQQDVHLLTVMRYVERNPVRAKLVKRAERWSWSSLRWWGAKAPPIFLHEGPVPRGRRWLEEVNRASPAEELESLRMSLSRGTPFGTRLWIARTADRLGLESTLRPRGRPRNGSDAPKKAEESARSEAKK